MSAGEAQFELHLKCYKIAYTREYRFDPERKWRVDFLLTSGDNLLAVEIEGGTWIRGRHQTGDGFTKDCEKYNALTLTGIPLMRFTTAMIISGEAIDQVRKFLASGG